MLKNKGDAFRDTVAELLRAAGFGPVETEQKMKFKKANISAIWRRQTIDGPVTYAIEAKNHARTISLKECSLFVAQYGELVRAGAIDRARLVSKGPVSAERQKKIRRALGRNLDCLTCSELQRRLLVLDSYLADLATQFRDGGINSYYVAAGLAARQNKQGNEDEAAGVFRQEQSDDCEHWLVLWPHLYGSRSAVAEHLGLPIWCFLDDFRQDHREEQQEVERSSGERQLDAKTVQTISGLARVR